MLTTATRQQFNTLLDALTLSDVSDDKPALVYVATDAPPQVFTQQQFQQQVQRYATALHNLGIRAGDLIIIAHTQDTESIFAFWGAIYLGAIPSIFSTLTEKLNADVYMQQLSQLVVLSGVHAIFTTDNFAGTLADHVECPVYSSAILQAATQADNQIPPHHPTPDSIALLQHSSGTTGLQKGVALSHTAILNNIASYSEALQLTTHDVIASWLPLYHDMGLIAGFLLPLIQGLPLVVMSPFDWVSHPALLLRSIDHYKATLCWLPNFAYNHCVRRIRARDLEGLSLRSIRAFINCSEPVRQESHQLFLERFGPLGVTPQMLSVSYAMAENVFAVTQTTIGQSPNVDWVNRHILETSQQAVPCASNHPQATAQVSCGMPITGAKCQIIDAQGNPLPQRHIGEIILHSNSMLTSYYRRPDLNPFTSDGWYRTGDMGYLAENQLYIIGRAKDIIINAGKNIYPQDIEAIINTIPGVHPGRVVVFGVPDEREGTELIAALAEIDPHYPIDSHTLERTIRQQVSQHSTITLSYVNIVDNHWLIKTSSGKIARIANRDKWLEHRQQ